MTGCAEVKEPLCGSTYPVILSITQFIHQCLTSQTQSARVEAMMEVPIY